MDLPENDPAETDLVEEIGEESEDSEVSVGDCLAVLPRTLAESVAEFAFEGLFDPSIVLWLVAMAGWVILHLLMLAGMLAGQLLSSDYVSVVLFQGFLLFLLVLPMGFLFATLYDSAEDDGPRSLFSYASGPQSNVPPPENRV